MGFLKKIFGSKSEDVQIKTYADFWNWFQEHEKKFYEVVKNTPNTKDITEHFFSKLSPQLSQLGDCFNYLTGMLDEQTAELVLTPDGIIKDIVWVEELISTAPSIPRWKFTALKPAMDTSGINMNGHQFNTETLSFYSNDSNEYPDEININIVYKNYTEEEKNAIISGVYIFLDNFLGELTSVSVLDDVTIISPGEVTQELIPIEKLKAFIDWRQKEFIERYEGLWHDSENDSYSSFEGELEDGTPVLGVINTDLLAWDAKASHPWRFDIEISYDGSTSNGMPNNEVLERMNEIEDEFMTHFLDHDGYLNIGRQTGNNKREIYLACKDFRKPSKILPEIIKKYESILKISFDVFKDKYWRSLNRFSNH